MPRKTQPNSRSPAAFTLIELLTVITVLAILLAIIIPVVGRVREASSSVQCLNNLRQISTAARLYAQDNDNKLPVVDGGTTPNGSADNWVFILTGYYNRPDYLGSRGRLTTVGSKRRSPLLCAENIQQTENPPSGAASTYGMNDNLSALSLEQATAPDRVVMFTDMICFNSNWRLRLQPNRPDRQPAKIHQNKYHFVYLDGHSAAEESYPTQEDDPFWMPF